MTFTTLVIDAPATPPPRPGQDPDDRPDDKPEVPPVPPTEPQPVPVVDPPPEPQQEPPYIVTLARMTAAARRDPAWVQGPRARLVEHYEIAGYGNARLFAEVLGLTDSARILQETLDEEATTNQRVPAVVEA